MALGELGPWTLLEELGEDPATRWYRASRHWDGAIGILHRVQGWLEEDQVIRIWHDELSVVTRLNGLQILRVFDVGAVERGLYFVNELVEGPSLDEVFARAKLRERALDPQFSVRVAIEVLRALETAHELRLPPRGEIVGILHRDVGPWAVRLGWSGSVKLGGFGRARAIARWTGDGPARPPDVSYMSAETVRGSPLDPRADVYSAGALLWRMLAGRDPYPRESGRMLDIEQLKAIIAGDPPDVRTLAPEVPQALAAAIAEATRRDLAQRTSSARAFREALENAVGDPGQLAVSGFLASLFES